MTEDSQHDIWDVSAPDVPFFTGKMRQERRSPTRSDWEVYVQPTRVDVYPPRVRVVVAQENLGGDNTYNPEAEQFSVELMENGSFHVSRPEVLNRMDVAAEAHIYSVATTASVGLKYGLRPAPAQKQTPQASPEPASRITGDDANIGYEPMQGGNIEEIGVSPQAVIKMVEAFARSHGNRVRDHQAAKGRESFADRVKDSTGASAGRQC